MVATLGAATVAAPVTRGKSYAAAMRAADKTGVEISVIILASAIGIALIIAMAKGYEEVSYKDGEFVFRKKQRKNA